MKTMRNVAGRAALLSCCLAALLTGGRAARADWIQFVDQTATRLSAAADVGVSDVEEKDYAWGDVDNDGDIDLVVARKQGWTTPGKRTNVLFLNENGVLVDRTSLYAVDSDVPGDLGFNTPTNDRDVQLTDVNGDGYLDIVTATTISDGETKAVGYPRVYRNKGRDGSNVWLGFRYEEARIPAMLSYTGVAGRNPRFCAVAAGDLTGDGRPDLYFSDYDTGEDGNFPEQAGSDFNDKLLINNGSGFFTDQTSTRFSGQIQIPGGGSQPFQVSAFGESCQIADVNGDGLNDIVKLTTLNNPLYVGVAYNNAASVGNFSTYKVLTQKSPYFVSVGELNNDGKLDVVITDDGADYYMLNQGNTGTGGLPAFVNTNFRYDTAGDEGFGTNSAIADLNNDGSNDVIVADVDVDIPGCNRRMKIFRNLGGAAGSKVTLQEQTTGTGCSLSGGNPSTCRIGGIPADKLTGVHDVAVFDIDGDGRKDLVVGRCTGTEVFMNVVPTGLVFAYPYGLPSFAVPGQPLPFIVQITGQGGVTPLAASARLFTSVAGGGWVEQTLTPLGNNRYQGSLPAAACSSSIAFYVKADAQQGGSYFDPSTAPGEIYSVTAATGTTTAFFDDIEGSVAGWSVVNDPSLTGGAWEQAIPNGTIAAGGQIAAPTSDAEPDASKVKAFVTQNGVPGGAAGASDVDGGPTDLISPAVNLAGTDAVVTYSRWFYSAGADQMTVWVSNDNGGSWALAETLGPNNNNAWKSSSFKVSSFAPPTSAVKIRFRVNDALPANVVEGGVDAFKVEQFLCAASGTSAGVVPDGSFSPGTPLTIAKAAGSDVTLSWGASCTGSDTDYAVYEGTLGVWYSHAAKLCSTGGLQTTTLTPAAGSTYYLVVAANDTNEGSYGRRSSGAERPVGAGACRTALPGACQ